MEKSHFQKYIKYKNKYLNLVQHFGGTFEKCSSPSQIRGDAQTPIYVFDDFLSSDECDKVIESIQEKLENSKVTRDNGDKYFRTNRTGYFDMHNELHKNIQQRICNLVNVDITQAEWGQIQHYLKGQEFKPHYDYFQSGLDDEYMANGGQRTYTIMVYLNMVLQGGGTNFVKLNQKFLPKRGQAIVWSNLRNDGSVDERTLHQGQPVEKGEKYIITVWCREKKIQR